jgi:hypothetical protein
LKDRGARFWADGIWKPPNGFKMGKWILLFLRHSDNRESPPFPKITSLALRFFETQSL